MKIGPYTLHAIETGSFGLDGGAMFGVVPRNLWSRTNPPDEKNRIRMSARALLAVSEDRKVLVDVGNGTKYSDKLRSIYKFDNSQHDLLSSLSRHGIAPGDITDVILTHLHFDHAGGSTILVDGTPAPTFPSARYYVQKDHWHAAQNPTERDRASFFPHDFAPLMDHGQLELIDGEGEILPGISVRLMHGHTTALQCPIVHDNADTLFYCADLMPTTSHIPVPWIMAYDLRPLQTLEEKKRLLPEAAEEGWTLFFEHDPVTPAATVGQSDKGFVLGDPVDLEGGS
ncbi:MAG: MBL fold metallo-hydrolase [Ignavibacteria bacterium]|nr:MBL fold metallo-hydrolase [Ignavibacteria bacterium]